MSCKSTILNQILQIIPRLEFQNFVNRHQAEKSAKGFSSWTHFVAMIFAQLSGLDNLRSITNALNSQAKSHYHLGIQHVSRSTLSYANKNRSSKMFGDIFYFLLNKTLPAAPRHKFKFKNPLYSIDSTTIDLCLSVFNWAKFRKTKGGIKLHVKFDHTGYIPVFAVLSDAKANDLTAVSEIPFKKGDVVTFDRGYNDYSFFASLCTKGTYFVTRLKKNAKYRILERKKVKDFKDVSSDQIISFTGFYSIKKCSLKLRRISIKDSESGKYIVILTNNFEWPPDIVGAIYKDRWQIEIFFKAMKQKLKIKSFVGTSKNALMIQIASALITYLLLSYMRFLSTLGWTIYSLASLLPTVLFSRKDLWLWLNEPFERDSIQREILGQLVLL